MRRRPRLLTIAGSDSGGGAGIQADLKTFAAFGAYGMSVVTAVTAQNTLEVTAVEELPPAMVRRQIAAVLDDIGADAIKIGMLASAPLIEAVEAELGARPPIPTVLDPVMIAKSGDRLLREDAVAALGERLLPRATLVTPNLPEAAALTGLPVDGEEERREAARRLAERGPAVLLKGGHGAGDEIVDLLLTDGRFHRFVHPRVPGRAIHGTGCTLSSAIAAGLGRGRELPAAVEEAIDYLQGAIRAATEIGHGHAPVDHLYRLDPLPDEGSKG